MGWVATRVQSARRRWASAERAGRVSKLLEAGCEVDAKDALGMTAMHEAAWQGHADCLKGLIAAGGGVDAKNDSGRTALMLAAGRGHMECDVALVAAGCDMDAVDGKGRDAMSLARENGFEVLEWMLAAESERKALAVSMSERNGKKRKEKKRRQG